MTESKTTETAQNSSSENQPQNMSFNLMGHYARDVSLECPVPSMSISSDKVSVGMNIGVATKKLTDEAAEVALKLRAEAKDEQGNVCYLAETEYVAHWSWAGFNDEQLIQVLSIDGAALVYPFARQVLMNLVQAAGYRAPMLDVVNFHSLYMQAQQQQQAQALKEAETVGAA